VSNLGAVVAAHPAPDGTGPTEPPTPKRVRHVRSLHGDDVPDDWYWLADESDPDRRPHLEAENAWAEAATARLAGLRERLFEEIKSRVQETDATAAWKNGPWWYYDRTTEGLGQPVHCRRPDDGSGRAPAGEPGGPTEQVLLDENQLAAGTGFARLGNLSVSPDGNLLAWSVDHRGDEAHTLHVRDLRTGEDLAEAIPATSYGLGWAANGESLFYTTLDHAQRPWQVWHHRLGTDRASDRLVFEEPDERFFVGVGNSRDDRHVVIDTGSVTSSEIWLLDATDPDGATRVVAPRSDDVEYHVEPHGTRLFIVSNHEGPDFALYETTIDEAADRAAWTTLIPHRPGVRIDGVDALRDHLVVSLREGGHTGLLVHELATGAQRAIPIDEPVATLGPHVNAEFDTAVFRYHYESLVTPATIYEDDLTTGERTLRRRVPVPGGYDPDRYESNGLWATAGDGTKVPISLVHRKGLALDGSHPCLLYGYGAYEASTDPWFSPARVSLLERGFVWGIAHVRGGGEMGRQWYEHGKLLEKPNSFSDFVACARHLIDAGYTSPARLAARGGSAGGLLMGAVANAAPDLFRAVVAEVPFVDALNTICDPTLPLTVTEWEEWGNPLESAEVYRVMRSYSPYENVHPVPYPAVLATAGLHDTRVGVHEPAKWVARLRDVSTGDAPIVLRIEMGAGHGGPTGRYDAWEREAFALAFVIDRLGAPLDPAVSPTS
jgi:oligopeptidase B